MCFLPPSAFRFLLKVACLDLAPKTVRERRHRGHRRGGVVCLPYPSAALGSPGAAPLPAVTGAVLGPAGGCTAPLLLLLLCSLLARGFFREVLGTKPAGLLGVLEFNPARCPSSTTCIYGNFLIWKIVYVFLRTALSLEKYFSIMPRQLRRKNIHFQFLFPLPPVSRVY